MLSVQNHGLAGGQFEIEVVDVDISGLRCGGRSKLNCKRAKGRLDKDHNNSTETDLGVLMCLVRGPVCARVVVIENTKGYLEEGQQLQEGTSSSNYCLMEEHMSQMGNENKHSQMQEMQSNQRGCNQSRLRVYNYDSERSSACGEHSKAITGDHTRVMRSPPRPQVLRPSVPNFPKCSSCFVWFSRHFSIRPGSVRCEPPSLQVGQADAVRIFDDDLPVDSRPIHDAEKIAREQTHSQVRQNCNGDGVFRP